MSQTYIGITIDIIDYYPVDYDYNSFGFIFISESKDFEREISYIDSNQICQKIPLKKKDIKYSIKVTKDDSLIGISEFTIPYQIISKKEKIYDKVCSISMSDSVKKLLFGSMTNYIPLKIGIHTTLQYIGGESTLDANSKKEKLTINQKKKKNPFTPTKYINKDKTFNVICTSNSGLNNKINSNNLLNNSISKISKKDDSHLTRIKNNKTYRGDQRACSTQRQKESSPKIKSMKNTFRDKNKNIKTEIKTEINENEEKSTNSNFIKNYTDDEMKGINDEKNEEKIENISFEIKGYDEILDTKTMNIDEISELKNNINNYIEENKNRKLNEINEMNEMINYTNNNLNNLLNYQMKYYELIQKEMNLGNKYKKLLLEYNEKYRNNLVRINKLKDDNKYNEIKKDILSHNSNIHNEEIINMKNNELDIFNKIYSKTIDESKNNNKCNNSKNEQFLLLFKILKKINNKFGPIQNLLNQSNSTEIQRNNLRKIMIKYKNELELENNDDKNKENSKDINNINKKNNKNIDKFDYVLSSKPDDIDIKIELFLKQFYLRHSNIPKIMFKKTSKNNYEYGKQKLMIKLEGEAIRVRYSGGYLLLDKYIELNATSEENKKKNIKLNDNTHSKNNIKKKNKK